MTTAARAGHRVHRDIAYAAPAGRGHLLDLYVPASGGGPFPLVVFQAGSAFRSDDTKGGPPPGTAGDDEPLSAASLARRWTPHGYAVAGLNVRSSAQAPFPAQVHDVKAALRHLRANAGRLGLDPGRFATMGTSSGGWVATMAGVTSGDPRFEGGLGDAGHSSAVQAVIDLYGPTDFLAMDAHRPPGGQEHDPADSPESALMGFPIRTRPDAVREANPAAHVTAGSPPIWIAHGTDDPYVPAHQSELLFAAYEAAGATATLTLVPRTGHTDTYLPSAARSAGRTVAHTTGGTTTRADGPAPTYDTLLAFLDEHLRRA
ncbi:alpha/beta hydrolase [Streptomyces sp. RFCAC02]|uniref:alpha/beta hydrolase n=1 Tax=Streptomyces sp. RFCAC02 TaxID=2499143 RepID=UPI00143CEF77|nr:alpha/beta hydrolase [Streptomyces sp. RFCAC02]